MSATLDARAGRRRFSTAARSSRSPGACIRSTISLSRRGQSVADAAVDLLARDRRAMCSVFFPARRRSGARSTSCRRSAARRASDILPLHGSLDADAAGSRAASVAVAPAGDRRHQHRRDIADRARRHGGRRRRTAEGGALRRRARHRQPRHRAHHGGRRGSARRPRRPRRARRRPAALGRARPPAPAPRAGDPPRRPVRRPRSTSSRGAAIRGRSSGSSRRRSTRSTRRRRCSHASTLIAIRHPQPATRSSDPATVHLTRLGEQVRHLPIHPRLARMLIAAGGARQMAQACAALSERHLLPARATTSSSDLLSALDHWRDMPPHVAAGGEGNFAVRGSEFALASDRSELSDAELITARPCRGIPIASHNAAEPGRPTCCSPRAPARGIAPRAASAMASS